MGFNPGKDNLTDLEVDDGTLSVDQANNRVGIGTTSPGHALEVESSEASKPVVNIKNTHDGTTAGSLRFTKDGATPADDETLGAIDFYGEDSGAASTQYASIDAVSADVTAGSTEQGTLNFKVRSANAVDTVAIANPESQTANTFCGGFGYKKPGTAAVDGTTLTATMSGACVGLGSPSAQSAVTVTLPSPSKGVQYRFFVGWPVDHVIKAGANILYGTIQRSGGVVLFTGTNGGSEHGKITLHATDGKMGDFIDVFSPDGTIWHVHGYTTVAVTPAAFDA